MMRLRVAAAVGLGLAVAVACGSDHVRRAAEEVQVVGGTPTVGQGLPGVSRGDGGMDASFGPAAPFQVDIFDQQQVKQVDILWVVDNSSSMQAKQDRLKANAHSFMQFLAAQQVDYHLGVVSTDTYDPAQSGKLQNKQPSGLPLAPQPWVSSDAGPTAENYFLANLGLGEQGTGDEKGLLGAMLALTPPLAPPVGTANPDAGAANCVRLADGGVDCFVRPGATLYTVIVSDEEDSSCTPTQTSGLMAGEGCTESDILTAGNNGYGSTDYWSRFFSGAKDGGTSRIATIVATDSTTRQCATEFAGFCQSKIQTDCAGNTTDCTQSVTGACCSTIAQCNLDIFSKAQRCHFNYVQSGGHTTGATITGSWAGCKSPAADGGVEFTAIYAPRYSTVAQETGGIASSVCDQDYTPALSKLGLQASGLRSEFPLSRAPLTGSVTVQMTPTPSPGIASTYVDCENHVPINLLRFASPPPPGTRIAVSYDVNVKGLTCP